MVRFYREVELPSVYIDDDQVYMTTERDYQNRVAYRQAVNVRAGLFANFIKMLGRKNMMFVAPDVELTGNLNCKKSYSLDKFDGVSLSSINKPYSKLVYSSTPKSIIEILMNPFALITDGVRCTHTFLYQMPMCKVSKELVMLRNRSKLEIKRNKIQPELPGVYGFTVFVNKENAGSLLKKITGKNWSLKGDGFLVSRQWLNQIRFIDITGQEHEVPLPVKMQGAARSKGIVLDTYEQNRVLVRVGEQVFPVHVIMNTQGKRKNKAANITASSMRLAKFMGEDVAPIEALNVEELERLAKETEPIVGTLIVNGEEVGEVIVGINKFLFDVSHQTAPKISKLNIDYVQAEVLVDKLKIPLFDIFPRVSKKQQLTRLLQVVESVDQMRKSLILEQ